MIDMPEGFDSYWQDVTEEVSDLRGCPVEVEHLPLRDNEVSTAYGLRFSGVGGYPLFALLTVPKASGPFPALMQAPAYGSVVGVPAYERRARYVVLAICHRGQRLSDSLYSAAYPGLLTDGLPDPSTYRWREIAADCLRAFDVLDARPDVDRTRLAVVGNDLAAITAALRPGVPYLLVNSLIFRGAAGSLSDQSAYPGRELADYVRVYPEQADQDEADSGPVRSPRLRAANRGPDAAHLRRGTAASGPAARGRHLRRSQPESNHWPGLPRPRVRGSLARRAATRRPLSLTAPQVFDRGQNLSVELLKWANAMAIRPLTYGEHLCDYCRGQSRYSPNRERGQARNESKWYEMRQFSGKSPVSAPRIPLPGGGQAVDGHSHSVYFVTHSVHSMSPFVPDGSPFVLPDDQPYHVAAKSFSGEGRRLDHEPQVAESEGRAAAR